MYLELLTTSLAVQQNLVSAYSASGRLKEIGLYFMAVNHATAIFFDSLEPPESCRGVHSAFLKWQRLGMEALAGEVSEDDQGGQAKREQLHIEASEEMARALETLTEA